MSRKKRKILCGIYKISNILDNRCYIGSSKDINKRWKIHLADLKRGDHHARHLQYWVNKYSINYLIFEVMELCLEEKLLEREDSYLLELKPEFNSAPRAFSCLGYKHSDEARQNMRNGQFKTPIAQYDFNGNFIRSYESTMEVYRVTGISPKSVSATAKGVYRQTNGFMWKFFTGDVSNIEPYMSYKIPITDKTRENMKIAQNKPERLAISQVKINQYTLEGIFIKTWDSVREASRQTGLDNGTISRCINGKKLRCGNFQWKLFEGNTDDIGKIVYKRVPCIK